MDILKIDREFIDGALSDTNDRSIVEAIVAVGHALGLEVLAEGLETPEQLRMVRSAGCDLGQGYLFQRPVPPEELIEGPWLLIHSMCWVNSIDSACYDVKPLQT